MQKYPYISNKKTPQNIKLLGEFKHRYKSLYLYVFNIPS